MGPIESLANPRDEWISVEMIPTYYSAEDTQLLLCRWYPLPTTLQSSGVAGGWVRPTLPHCKESFGGLYSLQPTGRVIGRGVVQNTFYHAVHHKRVAVMVVVELVEEAIVLTVQQHPIRWWQWCWWCGITEEESGTSVQVRGTNIALLLCTLIRARFMSSWKLFSAQCMKHAKGKFVKICGSNRATMKLFSVVQ